jgi:Glycosyl transferases group 1
MSKKIKTIAFLGNFGVDYCSEVHYKKTLEAMGYKVIPLQESKATYIDITRVLPESDMFFWVHTHGWNTPKIEEALKVCRDLKIPSVGYHLDLWLGIQREKDLETDPYWKIDYFFSVDQLMVDLLNSKPEMPKAFFLPAGVFGPECYLGEKKEQYAHDVIFVGSRGYHPEWPYRAELITWLEATYGSRFAQYGGGGRGTIRGEELNNLYASAKVVVGDTLCKGFLYPEYLSDRIFETTGRGGFLIHPFISGMERHFCLVGDSKEVVPYEFNNFENLKYSIDYYIQNNDEREAIRLRGHERTKKDHTYTSRLKYLIETIENENKI